MVETNTKRIKQIKCCRMKNGIESCMNVSKTGEGSSTSCAAHKS